MPLSHGKATTNDAYESTAFFVGNEASDHYFLFFGDVSTDAVAGDNRNEQVWHTAAVSFPHLK